MSSQVGLFGYSIHSNFDVHHSIFEIPILDSNQLFRNFKIQG